MFNEVLTKNYFELFAIPQTYTVNLSELQLQLRKLQKEYHPDNFANQDIQILNQALVISSTINQAYKTLEQPLARAIYLLQLHGVIVDLIHDTKFSSNFLMQQIELREQISAAEIEHDIDSLENIEKELKNNILVLELKIANLFAQQKYTQISELIKELAFFVKLEQLVDSILAQF